LEFFSKHDTHVKPCRRHVTAWFGEAEPKILWRASKDESTGSFWLRRHANGWTEIVRRDRAGVESILASFSSGDAAEHALSRLERAFTGARFRFGRILLWVLAIIGALYIVLSLYNYIVMREQVAAMRAEDAYQAHAPASAPVPQQPSGGGLVPGAPVDADSVLH
jgi:hypothetical protein